MTHRALVTGGTRGIGRAIAKAIVDIGGRVVITGRERGSVDRAVVELARETGHADSVAGVVADVRKRDDVEAAVAKVEDVFGGLDVVVNNAGVGIFTSIEKTSDEAWAAVIDTNLTGAFYMTRASIPALRRAGGGWIINIASLAGRNYFPDGGAYCASKAALIAMTESVMQEVRFDNIRVSVVMPGSVATAFSHAVTPADAWKLAPEDVAEVVVDLLRHPGRSLPSRVEIRPSQPPSPSKKA